MEVNLIRFRKNGSQKVFPLPSTITVIGRRSSCDVRIPLTSVSKRHCQISCDEGVLRVRDLGSANGTIVNGKKIKEAVIQPGDQLRIGPIGFVVQVDGKPEKITPPAAKKAAVKKEEKAGAKTEDVEIGGPAKDAEAKEDLDILIDDSESIKDDSNLLLDDLN